MSADSIATGVMFVLSGIFTVVWFLLRQKDAAQAAQIALLFSKHDDDAQRLADLELKIAERHYQKAELDSKFERLEQSLRDGLGELGKKFDRLAEALISARNH